MSMSSSAPTNNDSKSLDHINNTVKKHAWQIRQILIKFSLLEKPDYLKIDTPIIQDPVEECKKIYDHLSAQEYSDAEYCFDALIDAIRYTNYTDNIKLKSELAKIFLCVMELSYEIISADPPNHFVIMGLCNVESILGITPQVLDNLIKKIDKFEEIFPYYSDLKEFCDQFPHDTDKVFQKAFSTDSDIIIKDDHGEEVFEDFPSQHELLFNLLLKHKDLFDKIFTTQGVRASRQLDQKKVSAWCEKFPNFSETIKAAARTHKYQIPDAKEPIVYDGEINTSNKNLQKVKHGTHRSTPEAPYIPAAFTAKAAPKARVDYITKLKKEGEFTPLYKYNCSCLFSTPCPNTIEVLDGKTKETILETHHATGILEHRDGRTIKLY